MTTDTDLELALLKQVFDWHDAPSNAPRTLDLTWQEAPVFFGLPADTADARNASWERIYQALEAMVADERMVAELYVNRVRNLKPGYRGTRELQAGIAAHLAAQREQLDEDRARLDADRQKVDADSETVAQGLRELEEQSETLDTRMDQLAAAQAELAERQTLFDRDRVNTRQKLDSARAAAEADLKSAGKWRMAGVAAVTLAVLAAIALAATQGFV